MSLQPQRMRTQNCHLPRVQSTTNVDWVKRIPLHCQLTGNLIPLEMTHGRPIASQRTRILVTVCIRICERNHACECLKHSHCESAGRAVHRLLSGMRCFTHDLIDALLFWTCPSALQASKFATVYVNCMCPPRGSANSAFPRIQTDIRVFRPGQQLK